MRTVNKHIEEKIKKDPGFSARYDLIKQKAVIASKIIAYRNKHDLSQTKLAAILGVTQQYISKIEEGEFHNLESVENILHAIGYSLRLKVVRWHKASVREENQELVAV
ncbi:MAG: helix-turn-helix domain-containing protein [Candidatus Omnitrophica bacterium]|nr:helix-turn-helix domain-containing protein [Candidatus Omnitrophota bacterium]